MALDETQDVTLYPHGLLIVLLGDLILSGLLLLPGLVHEPGVHGCALLSDALQRWVRCREGAGQGGVQDKHILFTTEGVA